MVEESESTLALEETTAMDAKDSKLQERNICIHKKNGRKLKKWKRKIYNKDDGGTGKYRLVSYEELPEYMKENEFLRKYYRSEWPLSHAFLSLFSWHNETINVWTHLLGFLLFFGLTLMHLRNMPQLFGFLRHLFHGSLRSKVAANVSSNPGDLLWITTPNHKLDQLTDTVTGIVSGLPPPYSVAPLWPFMVFLAGSMLCLLTSSLCHLLCCHSRRLNLFLSRLDYAGIAIMIAASFFPPISYAFMCTAHWRLLYLSIISALGVLAVLSLLAPEATRGPYRAFRALLFTAMGLTGLVPAVHISVVNWSEARRRETISCEAAMAVLYLVGTGFYVSRVPERWRPGKFDLVGHSHQMFHVFVVAGAIAHYEAALLFLEWREEVGCGFSR
ncbi:hypothetical protein KSP40_PGU010562 [Platanthera guangdongensis]|uniref:Uncharacterized protein n=1 Tax=Platanthera guangdongensis TaxID=2320717 RepID=A0ABR2ME46_9ASPA